MGIFRENVKFENRFKFRESATLVMCRKSSHDESSCVLHGFRIQEEAKSVDCLPADASQISNSAHGQAPYDGAEQIIWE